jgi:hypothetical protein
VHPPLVSEERNTLGKLTTEIGVEPAIWRADPAAKLELRALFFEYKL